MNFGSESGFVHFAGKRFSKENLVKLKLGLCVVCHQEAILPLH